MRALVVIPARLASTRLPRKPLRLIAGRPMIEHVYHAVRNSPGVGDVLVATDAAEIYDFCRAHSMAAMMTSESCRSGTDRIYEVACKVDADVYLNVQGDEPLARAEHVSALLAVMREEVAVGTLKTPMAPGETANPNVVKVVTNAAGRALYFSRAAIPFDRDGSDPSYYKHLGFYAYRRSALEQFCRWPESALERAERLEQLRFLENGVDIYVGQTPYDTVGVDTEEDLQQVERILLARPEPRT